MKTKKIMYPRLIIYGLSLSMLLFCACSAKSQTVSNNQTPVEQRAKALSEKMKKEIPITDSTEYEKVYALNLKYAQKMQEAFQGAQGKMAKISAAKSVRKKKDKEMKTLLSKDQFKKYQELEDEQKEAMRERFKSRNNN